jgi:hypothetical protein
MRSIAFIGLAAALLGLAVVPRSTTQEKKDARELVSVLVVAFDKEKVTQIYRLTDGKQLSALEGFFPNYRSRLPVEGGNAWYPDYEVYFNFSGGETLRLEATLKRTPALWRAFERGDGDHELKGDFRKFVASLKPGGVWRGTPGAAPKKSD